MAVIGFSIRMLLAKKTSKTKGRTNAIPVVTLPVLFSRFELRRRNHRLGQIKLCVVLLESKANVFHSNIFLCNARLFKK